MVGLHHHVVTLQMMRDGENMLHEYELEVSSYKAEAIDVAWFCIETSSQKPFFKLTFEAMQPLKSGRKHPRKSSEKVPKNGPKISPKVCQKFGQSMPKTQLKLDPAQLQNWAQNSPILASPEPRLPAKTAHTGDG